MNFAFDFHSRAARLVEQVYHILVGEAVEFRLDVGFPALFRVLYLFFYKFLEGRAHVVGRDEKFAAFQRPVRGDEVEDAARVRDDFAAAGEQSEV